MSGRYQAVLLIAFGGPRSSDEIRPFLARVTKGIPTPPERLEEVARHYQAVGGKSPLNEITLRQAEALQKVLNEQKFSVGVYVGMRNSRPFFVETLKRMADDGVREALGFILSSQQKESVPLVFTAHSVPIAMAARSPYVSQIETTAKLIADKLHRSRWSIAYQSRSGKPTDPWLEPDINQVVHDLAAQGIKEVIAAAIGFVCDHVEVLYDLDIEAKNSAERAGVSLFRACSPNDHPTFIQMMADVITRKLR